MPRRKAQVAGDGPETRARKRTRLAVESGCCWPTTVKALANRNLLTLVLSYHEETYDAEWDLIQEELGRDDLRRAVARQSQFEFHHHREGLEVIGLFGLLCRTGKLDAAKWVHATFQLTVDDVQRHRFSVFRFTCSAGQLLVAEWLHATFAISKDLSVVDAFQCACQHGHLAVAQWLHLTYRFTAAEAKGSDNSLFSLTCRGGHQTTAQWIHDTFVVTLAEVRAFECRPFRWACEHGFLTIAQWLHATFHLTAADISHEGRPSSFIVLCARGNLLPAQWMYTAFRLSIEHVKADDNRAFRLACANGHLSVAHWLHSVAPMSDAGVRMLSNYAFRWACFDGHLDVAQWLYATFPVVADDLPNTVSWMHRSSKGGALLETQQKRKAVRRWLRDTLRHG